MKRTLVVFAVATSLMLIGQIAGATTGLWSWTPKAGFPNVYVDYPSGTGAAPTDRQPDGGVIKHGDWPDGGMVAFNGALSGFDLNGVAGFSVQVVSTAADTGVMSAGTLQAYLYNPISKTWSRAPDLDLTVASGQSAAYGSFQVTGGHGRIAYVPSGLTAPVRVYFQGMPK